MKTGIATLPLHYGKAPHWLFERMRLLAREILYILTIEGGKRKVLENLSDPYWFQAFGCLLGFDWHSSGLTTTVCGAIKESLKDIGKEIGIFAAGGKGSLSLQTPQEIEKIAENFSLSISPHHLTYASRLSAKVDNSALQDGFQLYHHTFIFTEEGDWAVIQQGMDPYQGWARRYHWLSQKNLNFVDEPHKAICSEGRKEKVLNLVAKESKGVREVSSFLIREKPEKTIKEYKKLKELYLPKHHEIKIPPVRLENFTRIIYQAHEREPQNFEELLCIKGVGPRTLRALALISELLYGEKASRRDPARFSFAHGGKDGYPFPVDRKTYDQSIAILKEAVSKAKIGRGEKLKALRRLSQYG